MLYVWKRQPGRGWRTTPSGCRCWPSCRESSDQLWPTPSALATAGAPVMRSCCSRPRRSMDVLGTGRSFCVGHEDVSGALRRPESPVIVDRASLRWSTIRRGRRGDHEAERFAPAQHAASCAAAYLPGEGDVARWQRGALRRGLRPDCFRDEQLRCLGRRATDSVFAPATFAQAEICCRRRHRAWGDVGTPPCTMLWLQGPGIGSPIGVHLPLQLEKQVQARCALLLSWLIPTSYLGTHAGRSPGRSSPASFSRPRHLKQRGPPTALSTGPHRIMTRGDEHPLSHAQGDDEQWSGPLQTRRRCLTPLTRG